MKTHAALFITILIATLCFALPIHGQTTTVRGQVVRMNGGAPVANISVDLLTATGARSVPSLTGANGMYYLYNIPAGDYHLEVWSGGTPLVYPVRIVLGAPLQDLPRATVPW
jgi:Carboxypeptidase regulatory-like domain